MVFTEERLKVVSRLVKTQEGKDFVDEILKPMQEENYKDFLKTGKQYRDEICGFGNCIFELVELFTNCDTRLQALADTQAPDRT
jgi:hypothetical protein